MRASIALIFCLLFSANIILGSHAALKTMFIDDLCYSKSRATIYTMRENSAGILMNRPQYVSSEVLKCQITLVSPKKSSIVLSIYSYDFSPTEHLTVEDSDGFIVKLIGKGTYKDEKKSLISKEKIIISYTTSNSSTSRGFQFTYTEVRDSPCYENEFSCKNGKCILKELVCNGHNHCGDNSDQIKCVPETRGINNNKPEIGAWQDKSSLPIILLSVLALMLLIVTISFIAVILKFAGAKKQQTGNSDTRQPNANNALQSIAYTIPQQDIEQPTIRNQQVLSQRPQAETFYNRLRQSFRRGNDSHRVEEGPVHQETYQVPSMYPNLDQTPSAPEPNGIENLNFKIEE